MTDPEPGSSVKGRPSVWRSRPMSHDTRFVVCHRSCLTPGPVRPGMMLLRSFTTQKEQAGSFRSRSRSRRWAARPGPMRPTSKRSGPSDGPPGTAVGSTGLVIGRTGRRATRRRISGDQARPGSVAPGGAKRTGPQGSPREPGPAPNPVAAPNTRWLAPGSPPACGAGTPSRGRRPTARRPPGECREDCGRPAVGDPLRFRGEPTANQRHTPGENPHPRFSGDQGASPGRGAPERGGGTPNQAHKALKPTPAPPHPPHPKCTPLHAQPAVLTPPEEGALPPNQAVMTNPQVTPPITPGWAANRWFGCGCGGFWAGLVLSRCFRGQGGSGWMVDMRFVHHTRAGGGGCATTPPTVM